MPVLEHVRLEGDKIILRPLEVADVPIAFPLIHHRREVTRWLIWEGPETEDELVPWFENWVQFEEGGENYHLAILDRETGLFCGSIGVRFAGHPFQGDLGYWLAEEKWGRGFVTEAVAMVSWLAFAKLEAFLVYALVFEGNTGSVTVLERSGFEEVPLGLTRVMKGDREVVEHFYSLSRSDWEERGRPGGEGAVVTFSDAR